MMIRKKTNEQIEQEILDADQEWDDHITGITAQGYGLTLEQYREWLELEGDELDAYMRKHSTLKLKPESGQGSKSRK